MDDVLAGKFVSACDLCGTGRAAVQRAAFAQEGGARGAVDCAVDAAAAEEGIVWREADRVSLISLCKVM